MDFYMALWWIPAGTLPSVIDAKERLANLKAHGPSPYAFTFRQPFPPLDSDQVITPFDEACPA
jgi:Domain of unknown function (DUF3291)